MCTLTFIMFFVVDITKSYELCDISITRAVRLMLCTTVSVLCRLRSDQNPKIEIIMNVFKTKFRQESVFIEGL